MTYWKNGTEWACPTDLIIDPKGDMYGYFPPEEDNSYGQWYWLGQYNKEVVELMVKAGCNQPLYDNKPC